MCFTLHTLEALYSGGASLTVALSGAQLRTRLNWVSGFAFIGLPCHVTLRRGVYMLITAGVVPSVGLKRGAGASRAYKLAALWLVFAVSGL